ncbi:hypothetical protein FACS189472_00150 [Alphaproteobacteria bacterium]|nr:hypothetical protein FACS189472_00150 [Alphaproteobacteria bacterium]
MIKLIALVDQQFGISKNSEIPWSFSDDLKFFRKNTENCVVVMGRKTFFSIPNAPLINRTNCVLSVVALPASTGGKGINAHAADIEVYSSVEDLMRKHTDFWVIGGAEIYNYFLTNHLVNYALITQVHRNYNADKFIDESLLIEFQKKTLLDSGSKRLLHNELFSARHLCRRARKNAAQDRSVLNVHEDSLERNIACAASTGANCGKEPLCSCLSNYSIYEYLQL